MTAIALHSLEAASAVLTELEGLEQNHVDDGTEGSVEHAATLEVIERLRGAHSARTFPVTIELDTAGLAVLHTAIVNASDSCVPGDAQDANSLSDALAAWEREVEASALTMA